jgi:hypothetical protein
VIMCRADSFGMDDRTCLDGRSRNDIAVVGVVAAPAIYKHASGPSPCYSSGLLGATTGVQQ